MSSWNGSIKDPRKAELALSSFASLLSSAVTSEGEEPLATGASALPHFLREGETAGELLSLPSLSLHSKSLSTSSPGLSLEQKTALKLAVPLRCQTTDDLRKAPALILKNVSSSFSSLIDSRLRGSLEALANQAQAYGASSHRTRILMNLLDSGTKDSRGIRITTVVTSYRVLEGAVERDSCTSPNSHELILSLVFEATIDLSILENAVSIPLHAPGTITGSFDQDSKLSHVKVDFDTGSLLQTMMQQARLVVKKAMNVANDLVSRATAAVEWGPFTMDNSYTTKRSKDNTDAISIVSASTGSTSSSPISRGSSPMLSPRNMYNLSTDAMSPGLSSKNPSRSYKSLADFERKSTKSLSSRLKSPRSLDNVKGVLRGRTSFVNGGRLRSGSHSVRFFTPETTEHKIPASVAPFPSREVERTTQNATWDTGTHSPVHKTSTTDAHEAVIPALDGLSLLHGVATGHISL